MKLVFQNELAFFASGKNYVIFKDANPFYSDIIHGNDRMLHIHFNQLLTYTQIKKELKELQ